MQGINREIENERKAEVAQLQHDLNQLLEAFHALRGDELAKLLKSGLLWLVQALFFLLTLGCVALFIYLNLLEPAVMLELSEQVAISIKAEVATLSAIMLVLKVIVVLLCLLFMLITSLLGRIRRKNRMIRAAAGVIETLIAAARARLENAQERLKQFSQFAADHERKAGERGGAKV